MAYRHLATRARSGTFEHADRPAHRPPERVHARAATASQAAPTHNIRMAFTACRTSICRRCRAWAPAEPARTRQPGTRRTIMASNLLNGGQVIVDYLIREKVPYVFGLCGHGNIGFIDALHARAGEIKTVSVHHESVAGFMADVYYRVSGQPTATFTSCGPGLGEPADQPRQRVLRLRAVLRGDGQRPDQPVQPRRVPGDLPALPGGFPVDGARLLQARVPAHDRGAAAGRRAPGVEDHGDRASRARWCSTCRSTCSTSRSRRRRRGPRTGTPISPAAAAPIRKAWRRRPTC